MPPALCARTIVCAEINPAKNITSVKMNTTIPSTPFETIGLRRAGWGLCSTEYGIEFALISLGVAYGAGLKDMT